jgi:FtsZ-binding cell division protein ZapB
MKLLFFSLLSIFTLVGYVKVEGVKEPKLTKDDRDFKQLMSDFNKTLEHNKKVQIKADKTKDKLIVITTNKINELSNENKSLKNEISSIKIKIDTIYIHDTIQVKEKKNFWGKTKIDTTAN